MKTPFKNVVGKSLDLNFSPFIATFLALLGLLSYPAHGASGTWNGNVSLDWNDGGNWSGGTAPGVPGTAAPSSTDNNGTFQTGSGSGTIAISDSVTNRGINKIIFNNAGSLGNFAIGSSSNNLYTTRGGGISVTGTYATSVSETIKSNLMATSAFNSVDFTLTTSTGFMGTLTIAGDIATSGSGVANLQIQTSSSVSTTVGDQANNKIVVSGAIKNGASGGQVSVTRTRNGVLDLTGANTFTGGFQQGNSDSTDQAPMVTQIGVNSVRDGSNNLVSGAFGTGTLTLRGGTIESDGMTARTIYNHIEVPGFTNVFGDATNNGVLTLAGSINLSGSTTLQTNSDIVISGVIGDATGSRVHKAGTATLTLSGPNTYVGLTTIDGGVLSVSSINSVHGGTPLLTSSSLGAPTTVANGTISFGSTTWGTGTLKYTGTGETTDRVIKLAGTTGGATIDQSGSGLLKFTSDLVAPGTAATDNRKTLTLQGSTAGNGEISGAIVDSVLGTAGQLATSVTKSGTNTWTLSGTSANSYTGRTTVSSGELDLNKTAGVNAITGTGALNIASPDVLVSGGTLKWLATNQVADNATISLTSGTVNLNGFSDTVGDFSNSGGTFSTGVGKLKGTGASVTWSGGTNTINNGGTVEDAHVVISGGTNTVQGGATGGVLQVDDGGTGLEMTGGSLVLNSDNAVAGKLLLGKTASTSSNVATFASSTTSTITSGLGNTNPGVVDLNGGTSTFTIASGTTASKIDLSVGSNIQNGTLSKAGAGAMEVTGNNTYASGTTVSNGKLYVNNAGGASYAVPTSQPRTVTPTNGSGSGTGTGSVTVQSGGALAGSGTIASTSGGVTVQSGGTLSSGGVQVSDATHDTISGTGLTLNNAANLSSVLAVNGGASLTFALGAGSTTGFLNFANPNTNSTYLSIAGNTAGEINFGTSAPININLVDLTAFQPRGGDTLQLRYQNPYLLIQAGSNLDYNLFTTGGYQQNGYVTGIGSSNLGSFNLAMFNINGTDITTSANYPGLKLYLYNGDLEVVPEPSTWAMMIGGLALLIIIQRRKTDLS